MIFLSAKVIILSLRRRPVHSVEEEDGRCAGRQACHGSAVSLTSLEMVNGPVLSIHHTPSATAVEFGFFGLNRVSHTLPGSPRPTGYARERPEIRGLDIARPLQTGWPRATTGGMDKTIRKYRSFDE